MKTKQDIIREGIAERLKDPIAFVDVEAEFMADTTITELILSYLHSQGVVLKVGSKWPIRCSECNQVGTWVEEDFTLIEPLIKE